MNDSPAPQSINRRTALHSLLILGAGAAIAPLARGAAAEAGDQRGLGLVIYDCALRRKWLAQQNANVDLFKPLTFLQHCRELGAKGMQAPLGVLEGEAARALREYAERHGMFIDGIASPPKDDADLARFEAEIRTAAEVGALAVRTVVMPGRRYEQFKSLADVRVAGAKAQRMLELAAPIVAKHRVRLAVENHKDQRIDERLALFRQLDCEFIGACIDTGNSFALLDDPYGAIEALAPFAFTVHLKDQALGEYEDGFLLGDIPLGEGAFDLKRMVELLRRAKPNIHFQLELITRDPLKVACLTESYWQTLSNVAGADLARTLRIVRQHRARQLQQVSSLSLERQVELEDANVAASLRYAREQLGL